MKYALVGYGISNRNLARYLSSWGHEIFVSEMRALSNVEKQEILDLNGSYEENGNTMAIADSDTVVVSPSIRPDHPIIQMIPRSKIFTDIDIIMKKRKPKHVIGITGTNGKTTVSKMMAHVLSSLGKKAIACGNIGQPASVIFDAPDLEFAILELSSFQLFWAQNLPIDIGLILNIRPDHLDWHPSFEHYAACKSRILAMSKTVLYNRNDPETRKRAEAFCNAEPFTNTDSLRLEISQLNRNWTESIQNVENIAAVIAVCEKLGISAQKALRTLKSFEAPFHRMQPVAEINGITYIDDSKATNASAVIAALKNFSKNKVILILSGNGKNEDYGELLREAQKVVKRIVVFGEMKKHIFPIAKSMRVPCNKAENMEEAVLRAHSVAVPGDTVLLSPAGSSFDLYENYAQRGNHFQKVVESLKQEAKRFA